MKNTSKTQIFELVDYLIFSISTVVKSFSINASSSRQCEFYPVDACHNRSLLIETNVYLPPLSERSLRRKRGITKCISKVLLSSVLQKARFSLLRAGRCSNSQYSTYVSCIEGVLHARKCA